MSVTIKQIAPSLDEPLMGLEKYGYSVFPGVVSEFEIPQQNGKIDLKLTQDQKKFYEDYFKLDFDSESGQSWLKNYTIKVDHDITALDPKNVEHSFILHILKTFGGFGLIAMTDNAIDESAVNNFKFMVSDELSEVGNRVSKKEIKLNALTKLRELWLSNTNRLCLLANYIFPANVSVGDNKTLAFDKLEEFITKTTGDAELFLRVTELDPEYVQTVVMVKSAIHRGIIRKETDGQYSLHSSGTKLGRNEEEVIVFLTNPANRDLLGYGNADDLPYSVHAQLNRNKF